MMRTWLIEGSQEANWYKPEPGEPYRPLIAMPSRIKQIQPWLSYCTEIFFTAYDPPSILKVATALTPPTSPSDPKAPLWAPVPSPTLDAGARQTVGVEVSIPVPASIPTAVQPKATINIAPAPPRTDPGHQPDDPVTQQSPPSHSRPNTVEPNSDPEAGIDPQQGSNSKQNNEPNQASSNSGDPGQEADHKPDGDANDVNSNQGSDKNADPVLQTDPKQTGNANLFDDSTEGQAKTINNQVIHPLSHGISIAGTTLTPGAPPITVSGTPIHFGSSAFVVGISTAPLAPEVPTQMITTIAGQAITAAPDAVAIAGNILSPGGPGTTIDGTILSLDTAGQFVVGSKIIPFASKIPEKMTTTIGGQVITAVSNGIAIAGTTLSPGAPGMTVDGTWLSLDTASQLVLGSKTIPLESTSPSLITTIIGGQVVTAAPNAIAIAGTALTPGASGVTVGGTLVSLNTAGQLVVGAKTIVLQSGSTGLGGLIMGGLNVGVPSEVADPITTTIDGQIITAGPTALAMAGTTLTPGAPGFTINGTLISLNTAAQLVVGSKTIPLESERAGSSGETAGLGGLGAGGPFGPFSTKSLSPTQGSISTGAVNGTNTGVQAFKGDAASSQSRFFGNKMAGSVIAISVLAYMC